MDDDDWVVTPVSDTHPFFTTVMSWSQVQKLFQLVRMQQHRSFFLITQLEKE
jgi:hypothetical protein